MKTHIPGEMVGTQPLHHESTGLGNDPDVSDQQQDHEKQENNEHDKTHFLFLLLMCLNNHRPHHQLDAVDPQHLHL